VAHGQALACLTPPIMRFNIERGDQKTVEKYCDIAKALGKKVEGVNRQNALESADAVTEMIKAVGLENRLGNCGVTEENIEKMADYSLNIGMGAISCNPVMPTREEIINIYKESL
jgi:alcohol dehydrogenase class IV